MKAIKLKFQLKDQQKNETNGKNNKKSFQKKNFLIKINIQIKTTRMFKLTHFKKSF